MSLFTSIHYALTSTPPSLVIQFLSVNVEPFQEQYLSTNILRRLIKKYDVIEDIRHKDSKPTYVYERNKAADYFCLVLQVGGRKARYSTCFVGQSVRPSVRPSLIAQSTRLIAVGLV